MITERDGFLQPGIQGARKNREGYRVDCTVHSLCKHIIISVLLLLLPGFWNKLLRFFSSQLPVQQKNVS